MASEDILRAQISWASMLHRGEGPEVIERRLRDGTRHRLVKVYGDADSLSARFAACGWAVDVRRDGADWIVGTARPVPRGTVARE